MKVVIAVDSFKGSMNSMEAGLAAKAGIEKVCGADIVVKPLADGGEGTTEALVEGLGGQYIYTEVTGPLGEKQRQDTAYWETKKQPLWKWRRPRGLLF